MKIKENHKVVTDETTIDGEAPHRIDDGSSHRIDESSVKFDADSGRVSLTLSNGDQLTLSSPKAKAFLLLQSWFSSTPEDQRSDAIAMLRLAYYCISKYNRDKVIIETPTFSELFDNLEMKDVEVMGQAVNYFRDIIERSIPKNSIQLPK